MLLACKIHLKGLYRELIRGENLKKKKTINVLSDENNESKIFAHSY